MEKSIFDAGIANSIAKIFCKVLEAAHYYCGIYTTATALNRRFSNEVKNKYTIWVAHWGARKPDYNGKYGVWQYKVGSTSGVSGRFHLDYGYIDFEPIMKNNHLNGY